VDELTVHPQIPKLLKFRYSLLHKRRRGEKGEEHRRKGEREIVGG